MAEHEPCIGQSDDWYTPPEIFAALGLTFDLDPSIGSRPAGSTLKPMTGFPGPGTASCG
ncbi:hypothetical protein [Azospirillum himalayense]|uniref:Uncharacterized protein n=1 Tax=Azospirillum himalayense TaxID=654847 RepID=A0ABW0GAA6_9PROT